MKEKLLMTLAIILTLTVVFTVSVQSQTILPLRLGELPRMTIFESHKMGELSCPSDHVLVVQTISSYRAWVSCPPTYLLAPIVTPGPISPLATPTFVATATKTPVLVPTVTKTPVPGATAIATATKTPLPVATATPLPVATATGTPVSVPTNTNTPVPVATATAAATGAATPTRTPTPGATAVSAANIRLNANTTYQTFESWEATDFNGNQDLPELGIFGLNPSVMGLYKNVLAGLAVNELGINRVRLEIMSGAENPADSYTPYINGLTPRTSWRADRQKPINDNADPNVIDTTHFQFSHLDHKVDTVVLPLKQQLAAKGETLYINLNYVDFGISTFEHKDNPQEYAEFILATFLHLQQKYGWVPSAVEIILEPDGNGTWSPVQIGNALVAAAQRLAANGFHPEFIGPSNSYLSLPLFDQMVQSVPAVLNYLTEFSYHCYGQCDVDANLQGAASRGAQYQIQTSQLEHIGHTYKDLHRDLKLANVSSWAQYALGGIYPGDGGGSYFFIDINNQANPIVTMQRRTKLLRQYMKFIKRGALRIEATSTNSILDPIAFINSGGKYVVVVKATSGSAISVADLPAGIFGIKYTTDQICDGITPLAYDVNLPDVTLTAGGVLNTNIPACGVITVYQK